MDKTLVLLPKSFAKEMKKTDEQTYQSYGSVIKSCKWIKEDQLMQTMYIEI